MLTYIYIKNKAKIILKRINNASLVTKTYLLKKIKI